MKNLIASLTLEEKAAFLTGAASMETAEISRLCTILYTNGKDYTIRRVGVDMIG